MHSRAVRKQQAVEKWKIKKHAEEIYVSINRPATRSSSNRFAAGPSRAQRAKSTSSSFFFFEACFAKTVETPSRVNERSSFRKLLRTFATAPYLDFMLTTIIRQQWCDQTAMMRSDRNNAVRQQWCDQTAMMRSDRNDAIRQQWCDQTAMMRSDSNDAIEIQWAWIAFFFDCRSVLQRPGLFKQVVQLWRSVSQRNRYRSVYRTPAEQKVNVWKYVPVIVICWSRNLSILLAYARTHTPSHVPP